MAKSDINVLDLVAMFLVLLGALNWGFIGLLNLNIAEMLIGNKFISNVVYALIGFAGLYGIYVFVKMIIAMVRD